MGGVDRPTLDDVRQGRARDLSFADHLGHPPSTEPEFEVHVSKLFVLVVLIAAPRVDRLHPRRLVIEAVGADAVVLVRAGAGSAKLPVRIDDSLPLGTVGLPVGLADQPLVARQGWATIALQGGL